MRFRHVRSACYPPSNVIWSTCLRANCAVFLASEVRVAGGTRDGVGALAVRALYGDFVVSSEAINRPARPVRPSGPSGRNKVRGLGRSAWPRSFAKTGFLLSALSLATGQGSVA